MIIHVFAKMQISCFHEQKQKVNDDYEFSTRRSNIYGNIMSERRLKV